VCGAEGDLSLPNKRAALPNDAEAGQIVALLQRTEKES
jgi:hypothetical protein